MAEPIKATITNFRVDGNGDYQFNLVDELMIDYTIAMRNTEQRQQDNGGYLSYPDDAKKAQNDARVIELFGDFEKIVGTTIDIYEGEFIGQGQNGKYRRIYYTFNKPNEYPKVNKIEYPLTNDADGKTPMKATLQKVEAVKLSNGDNFGNILLTFDIAGKEAQKEIQLIKYVGSEKRVDAKMLKKAMEWLAPLGDFTKIDVVSGNFESAINKPINVLVDSYDYEGKQGTFFTPLKAAK